MRIAFVLLSLATLGLPVGASAKPGKILLGPHVGDATILEARGLNSDKASVTFRRTFDDEIEYCTRNSSANPPNSDEVAACAKRGLDEEGHRVFTRRAWCERLTIYTEFGNFSMVNREREKESVDDGKPYRPIRTDWKDHRTGKIVGNCNACNTPQMLDTLGVLCPVFYDDMFKGLEPY